MPILRDLIPKQRSFKRKRKNDNIIPVLINNAELSGTEESPSPCIMGNKGEIYKDLNNFDNINSA